MVVWEKVQRPLDLGGLGILNLEYMGWALQMKWLWYMKTDNNHPWKGLDIKIHPNAVALFNIGLTTQVGNGSSTRFWLDKWFMGCCLQDLAPEVVAAVPPNVRESRTVEEALNTRSWPRAGSLWWAGMTISTFGMHCMIWFWKMWRTSTFGDSRCQGISPLNLHTGHFTVGQLLLNHGN